VEELLQVPANLEAVANGSRVLVKLFVLAVLLSDWEGRVAHWRRSERIARLKCGLMRVRGAVAP
jgi:hypothetical protein